MEKYSQNEQIISLINEGWDLESLSYGLEIPMERVLELQQQLEVRRFAKESIKNNQIHLAIEKLINYISSSEASIVEQVMLLKLKAYDEKTQIAEEDIKDIEDKKKKIGFNLDENQVLNELGLQIPKRKLSNINKKQQLQEKEKTEQESSEESEEQVEENIDYQKMIEIYKSEIEQDEKELSALLVSSQVSNRRELLFARLLNKKNLLAFAYFNAGLIEKSREELIMLIKNEVSSTAYKQMVRLEKSQGNLDDAKLWAYEGIDRFPNDIRLREQLISIAKQEKDDKEVIEQLRELIKIAPNNGKNRKRLEEVER